MPIGVLNAAWPMRAPTGHQPGPKPSGARIRRPESSRGLRPSCWEAPRLPSEDWGRDRLKTTSCLMPGRGRGDGEAKSNGGGSSGGGMGSEGVDGGGKGGKITIRTAGGKSTFVMCGGFGTRYSISSRVGCESSFTPVIILSARRARAPPRGSVSHVAVSWLSARRTHEPFSVGTSPFGLGGN